MHKHMGDYIGKQVKGHLFIYLFIFIKFKLFIEHNLLIAYLFYLFIIA